MDDGTLVGYANKKGESAFESAVMFLHTSQVFLQLITNNTTRLTASVGFADGLSVGPMVGDTFGASVG